MIRFAVYALCGVVFAAAVFFRARTADGESLRQVVSINSEWEKFGKPVEVSRIERGPMHFTTRVSGVLKDGRRIAADVTPRIAQDLRAGQTFAGCGGGVSGEVAAVSASANLNTGLHAVELRIQKGEAPGAGTIVVACVATRTAHGVLRVRRAAVRSGAGASFVWIVRDGKALRKALSLGEADEGFYRVAAGLLEGDFVVIGGWRTLKEGDRVRPVGGGNI